MTGIYQILTPHHFRRGLPLYARAHIRFLVISAYVASILFLMLCLPEGIYELIAGVLSVIGYIWLGRRIPDWEESLRSAEVRSRLDILSGVARLGQGAILLSVAGMVWLGSQLVRGDLTINYARTIVVVCLCVGIAAWMLITALHGWMDGQISDRGDVPQ